MAILDHISSPVAWCYILTFILLFPLALSCYTAWFHLHKFRGPQIAAYTRLWIAGAYAQANAGQSFLDASRLYGKLTRIGPNHLLTNDAEITCRVLGVGSRYKRSQWFDSLRFHPHYASIASERDPRKHDALRAKVSAGYTTRNSVQLEVLIDKHISLWITRLNKVEESRQASFDLARSVRTMTMELSAHITFSEGLDLIEDEKEENLFWNSLEQNAPYAQYISVYPWLFTLSWSLAWLPGIGERILLTENNDAGVGRIMKYSRLVVAKRFRDDTCMVDDMLGSWIKHGLSQHEAETEASIAMVTGAFPIASAVNTTLLHVFLKHRVLKRLTGEIDSIARELDGQSAPHYSRIRGLRFLQACLNETLRCFPPITQLRERIVPSTGDILTGRFVPGGTLIGLNTRALQQHPCFGAEPEVWRPERWLDATPEELNEMQNVQSLIFGYGSTKCLGVHQAMMVMMKILFEFLRHFEIETLRPEQPWVDQNSGVSFHRNFAVSIFKRIRYKG